MSLTKSKMAKLEEKDVESSDSCPSIDNFNAQDLQECFQAVIDKDQANPFLQSNNDSYCSLTDNYSNDDQIQEPIEEEKNKIIIDKDPFAQQLCLKANENKFAVPRDFDLLETFEE